MRPLTWMAPAMFAPAHVPRPHRTPSLNCAPRPSAEMLLDALLEEFEGAALEAAMAAVKRRLAEVRSHQIRSHQTKGPFGGSAASAVPSRAPVLTSQRPDVTAFCLVHQETHALLQTVPVPPSTCPPACLPALLSYPPQAYPARLPSLSPCSSQADEAASRGSPRWYRLREAALLVLGNLLASAEGVSVPPPFSPALPPCPGPNPFTPCLLGPRRSTPRCAGPLPCQPLHAALAAATRLPHIEDVGHSSPSTASQPPSLHPTHSTGKPHPATHPT